VASSGLKVQVLMARQDRRATQRAVHAKKRRTATIAPLVVLRGGRSGTPPSATPLRGSLGFPSPPAYFDRVTFSMSSSTGSAFVAESLPALRRPFQAVDHLHHHEDQAMRIVEGGGEASMSAWRLLNATAVSFAVSSSSLSVFNASRIDFDAAISTPV
jgi:hypothetical protein